MKLRGYQVSLYRELQNAVLNGFRAPLVVLPCGAGKTVLFAKLAREHVKKGGYVHFYVHRRELVDQTLETFEKTNTPLDNIYIGTVQQRKVHEIKPTMIIFDEAHHATAKQWTNIIQRYPRAYVVGLTATPVRLDGSPLNDIFDVLVEGVNADWLIDNKYLAPYDYYAPNIPTLKRTDILVQKGRDYDGAAIGDIMLKAKVYGDIKKHLDPKRKTIIYAPSLAFSEALAKEIGCAHLDGTTPASVRRKTVKEFKEGKVMCITNVDLFGEGFDVPDAEVAILLRPTKSTALFIQQAMRPLRYQPGKRATVYDLVGNVFTHGLPTQHSGWEFTGEVKKSYHEENEVSIRECEGCLRVYKGVKPVCPYCGHDNGKTQREIQEEKEAELVKIERFEKYKKYEEEREARTLDELIALGRRRGYKNPGYWAKMKMGGRRKK